MNNAVDVLVLGGGPGGYTAALYAARAGLSVLVLERLSAGGQMATTGTVENYPGFEDGVDGFELGEKMQRQAQRFGARTVLAEVREVALTESPKRVETDRGTFLGRTVVVATGAEARELGVPGEAALRGRGVSYCATCDGMLYRGREVAIVGGGNTAVGDALTLARLAGRVTLIHRRDALRASAVYLDKLRENGVNIVWNTEVKALQGDDRLTGLVLRNKVTGEESTLPVDGLFVAVGRRPETALFRGQLETDGLPDRRRDHPDIAARRLRGGRRAPQTGPSDPDSRRGRCRCRTLYRGISGREPGVTPLPGTQREERHEERFQRGGPCAGVSERQGLHALQRCAGRQHLYQRGAGAQGHGPPEKGRPGGRPGGK